MVKEKTPLLTIASLGASGKQEGGTVDIITARTLVVSARATYNASATLGLRVHLLFSPDGINWDTVDYAVFDLDLAAGATVQETHIVDPPETGYMTFKVENLDTVYAATNVKLWAQATKWPAEEMKVPAMQETQAVG